MGLRAAGVSPLSASALADVVAVRFDVRLNEPAGPHGTWVTDGAEALTRPPAASDGGVHAVAATS